MFKMETQKTLNESVLLHVFIIFNGKICDYFMVYKIISLVNYHSC